MENIYEWVKKSKFWLLVNFIFILILFAGVWIFRQDKSAPVEAQASIFLNTEENASKEEDILKEDQIFVDIKGQVANPGMYEANSNMRINDAIEMAGGFLEDAQTNHVNLAQRLQDQMVIFVPRMGEESKQEGNIQAGISVEDTGNEEKVNINTADESQLQTLNGIGQKRAQEIIRYRQANGSFKSLEDLKNVPGFGAASVEKLREFVRVN